MKQARRWPRRLFGYAVNQVNRTLALTEQTYAQRADEVRHRLRGLQEEMAHLEERVGQKRQRVQRLQEAVGHLEASHRRAETTLSVVEDLVQRRLWELDQQTQREQTALQEELARAEQALSRDQETFRRFLERMYLLASELTGGADGPPSARLGEVVTSSAPRVVPLRSVRDSLRRKPPASVPAASPSTWRPGMVGNDDVATMDLEAPETKAAAQADPTAAPAAAGVSLEEAASVDAPAAEAAGLADAASAMAAAAETAALEEVAPSDAPTAEAASLADLAAVSDAEAAAALEEEASADAPTAEAASLADPAAVSEAEAAAALEEEASADAPTAEAASPDAPGPADATATGVGEPATTTPAVAPSPPDVAGAIEVAAGIRAGIWDLLRGKVVGADLTLADGTVLARAGDPITPELVERAQEAGVMADLILDMTFPAEGGD